MTAKPRGMRKTPDKQTGGLVTPAGDAYDIPRSPVIPDLKRTDPDAVWAPLRRKPTPMPPVPDSARRDIEAFSRKLPCPLHEDSVRILALPKDLGGFGFKQLTVVQSLSVPTIARGIDVLVRAQTGTGKTLAYLIPLIERLIYSQFDANSKQVQIVILAPTRELALQIAATARHLLSLHARTPSRRYEVACLVGSGSKVRAEQESLAYNRAALLIGTPGRIAEHIRQTPGFISRLKTTNMVVLDEVDYLLALGYKDDISLILSHTSSKRQTIMFSATLSPAVRLVANMALRRSHQVIDLIDDPAFASLRTMHASSPEAERELKEAVERARKRDEAIEREAREESERVKEFEEEISRARESELDDFDEVKASMRENEHEHDQSDRYDAEGEDRDSNTLDIFDPSKADRSEIPRNIVQSSFEVEFNQVLPTLARIFDDVGTRFISAKLELEARKAQREKEQEEKATLKAGAPFTPGAPGEAREDNINRVDESAPNSGVFAGNETDWDAFANPLGAMSEDRGAMDPEGGDFGLGLDKAQEEEELPDELRPPKILVFMPTARHAQFAAEVFRKVLTPGAEKVVVRDRIAEWRRQRENREKAAARRERAARRKDALRKPTFDLQDPTNPLAIPRSKLVEEKEEEFEDDDEYDEDEEFSFPEDFAISDSFTPNWRESGRLEYERELKEYYEAKVKAKAKRDGTQSQTTAASEEADLENEPSEDETGMDLVENPWAAVLEMHSKKKQNYRVRVAAEFAGSNWKRGAIMFASDVAARGMNFEDVDLVVLVGLPASRQQYIHRVGRTGRGGKPGQAILLTHPYERAAADRLLDMLPIQKLQFCNGALLDNPKYEPPALSFDPMKLYSNIANTLATYDPIDAEVRARAAYEARKMTAEVSEKTKIELGEEHETDRIHAFNYEGKIKSILRYTERDPSLGLSAERAYIAWLGLHNAMRANAVLALNRLKKGIENLSEDQKRELQDQVNAFFPVQFDLKALQLRGQRHDFTLPREHQELRRHATKNKHSTQIEAPPPAHAPHKPLSELELQLNAIKVPSAIPIATAQSPVQADKADPLELDKITILSKREMVTLANQFAASLGFKKPPIISEAVANRLGLEAAGGLRIGTPKDYPQSIKDQMSKKDKHRITRGRREKGDKTSSIGRWEFRKSPMARNRRYDYGDRGGFKFEPKRSRTGEMHYR